MYNPQEMDIIAHLIIGEGEQFFPQPIILLFLPLLP